MRCIMPIYLPGGLSSLPGLRVRSHDHTDEGAMEVQIPFSVTDKIAAREVSVRSDEGAMRTRRIIAPEIASERGHAQAVA